MLYCNICCEPYHIYCLEDYERPKDNTHLLNWICPACKFCELCGAQNDVYPFIHLKQFLFYSQLLLINNFTFIF